MAHLVLDKAVEGVASVKKDGTTYLFTEESETTAFNALGHEVLQIQRVGSLESGPTHLTVRTQKGELFVFPSDFLVGIKFGAADRPARSNAGFR